MTRIDAVDHERIAPGIADLFKYQALASCGFLAGCLGL